MLNIPVIPEMTIPGALPTLSGCVSRSRWMVLRLQQFGPGRAGDARIGVCFLNFANVEAENSKRLILGVSGVEAKKERKNVTRRRYST